MITKKEILLRVLLAIIFSNLAGLLLKYFTLDDYIILLGFRLKLNLILPIFFFAKTEIISEMKDIVVASVKSKFFLPVFLVIIPSVIFLTAFYFMGKIDLGDPEYFYEFGLSSIFDAPIYFLWNLPHIFALILLLKFVTGYLKPGFLIAPLILILLFAYEFIPLKGEAVNINNLALFLLIVVSAGLMASGFRNVIASSFLCFYLLWSYYLFFGSGSKEIVHLLFAARYNSWEGLLWYDDKIGSFMAYIYFGVTLLGILPTSLIKIKNIIF